MKRILCIAFVLFASIGVFAQERTIEKTQFDTAFQTSIKKRIGKAYRTITLIEQSVEGRPEYGFSMKATAEYLPVVGYRSIYETNLSFGKTKKERIVIGDKAYTREGNGKWTEGKYEAPAAWNPLKSLENHSEYKFLGNEKLDDRNTSVYAKIEKSKSLSQTSNTEFQSNRTTRYWFAEDGELLKTENITENQTGDWVRIQRTITVYQLDPNIKIEAPI